MIIDHNYDGDYDDAGYPGVSVGPSAHVIMVATGLPVTGKLQIRHL